MNDPTLFDVPAPAASTAGPICKVEGCGGRHLANGLCGKHYHRMRRHGSVDGPARKEPKPPKAPRPPKVAKERQRPGRKPNPPGPKPPCAVDGCDTESTKRGMCEPHYRAGIRAKTGPCGVEGCETKQFVTGLCLRHYHRKRRWGTTDDPEPTPPLGPCSVDGCDATVKSRDLCGMHLQRWYRWGTTDLPERAKTRPCKVCGEQLPRESFTGSEKVCITCYPEFRREKNSTRLSRASGVARSAAEMQERQGGLCAICGVTEAGASRGRFHLDHDHQTGVVRGLLCNNCNAGLGQFKDDPYLLGIAAIYLQTH